ncbi:MAG: thiolase domain-containing protein [Anaerolineae bacterium]
MRDVCIAGIGQIPVGEHWDRSLRDLAVDAILAALADAQVERTQMLFVGNMLSGQLSLQENLGALVADHAGLRGIEAIKIEAACASAAAALRMAYLAVAGGLCDVALACGVEKMTESRSDRVTTALATAADATYESEQGVSFVALNALLMQRYMHQYGYRREDFAGFAVNAHANAVSNPSAMFRRAITPEQFAEARMVAAPISLLDSAGIGDGAAAVLVMPADLARRAPRKPVCIRASASATDAVALHDRRDPLVLEGAVLSAGRAYAQAGVAPQDIDLFELHDAFTIMSALSIEACGLAARGQGVGLAKEGAIALHGARPMSTMGGLKARGHPVGATGLYQVVEACLQLRDEAGANQIRGCGLALTQNIGGSGANVFTHILERCW